MLKEFKEFINRGGTVMIAVGLVMALYFTKIVDAILEGVINPIIAALFRKSDYREVGFDIGDARISIGLVIDAVISFVAVAFLLFLIVKAYNHWRRNDPAVPPTDNQLLVEIRDLLAAQPAPLGQEPPPTQPQLPSPGS